MSDPCAPRHHRPAHRHVWGRAWHRLHHHYTPPPCPAPAAAAKAHMTVAAWLKAGLLGAALVLGGAGIGVGGAALLSPTGAPWFGGWQAPGFDRGAGAWQHGDDAGHDGAPCPVPEPASGAVLLLPLAALAWNKGRKLVR